MFADVRRIGWVFHERFLFLVVEDVVEKYHGQIRLRSEVVLLLISFTVHIVEPVFQLFTCKFGLIRDPFLQIFVVLLEKLILDSDSAFQLDAFSDVDEQGRSGVEDKLRLVCNLNKQLIEPDVVVDGG